MSRALKIVWLALAIAGSPASLARAQDADLAPGEVRIKVFNETGPGSPMAEAMRPLEEFHARMLSVPPNVRLYPSLGPSSLYFPCGYTDGIDDPSGQFYAGARQSWTNMGTLAYTQWLRRQR